MTPLLDIIGKVVLSAPAALVITSYPHDPYVDSQYSLRGGQAETGSGLTVM
jgi:hypothetical protein